MRRINRAPRVQYSGFGKSRSLDTGHRSQVTGHAIPAEGAASPWRVGQSVVHPTFGAGVIVSAEGRGADARVQVNFKKGGLKWLMLEYARLIAA
jgi:hypothetical protein